VNIIDNKSTTATQRSMRRTCLESLRRDPPHPHLPLAPESSSSPAPDHATPPPLRSTPHPPLSDRSLTHVSREDVDALDDDPLLLEAAPRVVGFDLLGIKPRCSGTSCIGNQTLKPVSHLIGSRVETRCLSFKLWVNCTQLVQPRREYATYSWQPRCVSVG
jgi:hypothetical protein